MNLRRCIVGLEESHFTISSTSPVILEGILTSYSV